MIVGEDSGESFRELIARVPCETIVTDKLGSVEES